MKVRKLEISFGEPVEITELHQRLIVSFADYLCKRYKRDNPGRTMWPSGIGQKVTFIPMTREEEQTRGIGFDSEVFEVDCFEREDYKWPCKKCGKEQGDHRNYIVDPPAGDCDFEPAERKSKSKGVTNGQ